MYCAAQFHSFRELPGPCSTGARRRAHAGHAVRAARRAPRLTSPCSRVALPALLNLQVAKGMAYGRQEDTHELFYSVLNAIEGIQLVEAGGKDAYDVR